MEELQSCKECFKVTEKKCNYI